MFRFMRFRPEMGSSVKQGRMPLAASTAAGLLTEARVLTKWRYRPSGLNTARSTCLASPSW
ncbi:hypothetical protein GGTG_01225 [Gaeumannomyces tritici R3-111a-1]|uniref:Uncharacterized protein n=1 Tax=Gaeumannomyces tritici (strain R3-111a-1) TaxID=644352 RepID=J3NIZ1_GAET3|nr:hypothetical protein GGTG_01225 [Gaeumannomyces tritici R3-111a-1]EJT81241.1 hypothetical protein GGTG_01225 [Gaeumannomyces tritici R3-111a-1]